MRKKISGKPWPKDAGPILAAAEVRSNGSRAGTKKEKKTKKKLVSRW